MSRQRRIRDETDGASVYFNIDTVTNASDSVTGAGVFDTARALASSIATKLTGKAAKKIATKALEKGAEKVGEKTGEKLGVLLGEKIYDSFNLKSSTEQRNRGDLIFKELQHEKPKTQDRAKKPPGETHAKTISQQFEDLLNLF